ncbi:MAG: isoaspartyl peptidase/L-asparaginase [Marinilabiliales bacterium]|nr:isoaspartyl peptidase/L-asparaginase [Marinilabiliales bacterium]
MRYPHLKKSLLAFFLMGLSLTALSREKIRHALVIHGGAGVMSETTMTPDMRNEYKRVLRIALHTGDSVLASGGTCLDAVEKTIMVLEDSPLFNAGKGAVFNHDGICELDASLMYGKDRSAGAVAGIKDIKNPISLARTVMEKSEHVLLTGAGASAFAVEHGFKKVPNSYFQTENRYKQLQELQNKEREAGINDKHGTVGCVALDQYGNLAAGTSTGGMTNKKYGRIGDSPIIGAGTWADNQTCGISCTGHGEYYIRLGFARDIAAMMEYRGWNLETACDEEIGKLTKMGGTGGVIALDKEGNISMKFNTSGMFRGYIRSDGTQYVGIFSGE